MDFVVVVAPVVADRVFNLGFVVDRPIGVLMVAMSLVGV